MIRNLTRPESGCSETPVDFYHLHFRALTSAITQAHPVSSEKRSVLFVVQLYQALTSAYRTSFSDFTGTCF